MTIPQQAISVLVVDNHPAMRDTLQLALSNVPGIEVTTAADSVAMLAQLREREIDVVLMDVSMPGISGFEATRMVRAQHRAEVVMLSMDDSDCHRAQARLAGAKAFVLKATPLDELVQVIESVAAGNSCWPDT